MAIVGQILNVLSILLYTTETYRGLLATDMKSLQAFYINAYDISLVMLLSHLRRLNLDLVD